MLDIGGGLIALVAEQPLVAKQKILVLLKTSHQSVDFCLIFIGQVWVSEFMYYFVRKIDFSRHSFIQCELIDHGFILLYFSFLNKLHFVSINANMHIGDVLVQQINF